MWLIIAFVFVHCFNLINSLTTGTKRHLLEDDSDDDTVNESLEEAREKIVDMIDSIFGGECLTDNHCSPVLAFCDRSEGFTGSFGIDGECRPSIWIWVLSLILLLILFSACLCCICCGIFSCIIDSCRSFCRRKMYTPAPRSWDRGEMSSSFTRPVKYMN